jgi:hypothetical protein
MKPRFFLLCFLATTNLLLNCNRGSVQENLNGPCAIQTDSGAIASKVLTLSDAERIMGESAGLTCNTYSRKGDTLEYKCDYTADSQAVILGKTVKLYFMYEVYASVAAAENAYRFIYEGNRTHQGVEVVAGMGDEAYYHTDGTNFYFFLVRKKEKMFRMKLNKVTGKSSETAFKDVGKKIADAIQ